MLGLLRRELSQRSGRTWDGAVRLLATAGYDFLEEDAEAGTPVTRRRTLYELRLEDLRALSADAGLDSMGSKPVLVARLWRALLDEGGRVGSDLPPWVVIHRSGWPHASAAGTAAPAGSAQEAEDLAGSAAGAEAVEEGYLEAEGTQGSPYSRVFTPQEVAGLLTEARCDDVAVLDVRPRECSFTDFFVLATGRSAQHVFTAAHAVKYALKQRCAEVAPGVPPRVEGSNGSDWLVVDCGATIVHVMSEDARAEYDLEGLWGEGGADAYLQSNADLQIEEVSKDDAARESDFEWDERPVARNARRRASV
ncbi:hypothetical protein WJX81_007318 [Elliptochloris bilobata]|uniref:SAP domain-containing protein n=1 Tax=Elliptochloris bilobata TaxID=381761 RepID=A0AAW1RIC5_9CHLO